MKKKLFIAGAIALPVVALSGASLAGAANAGMNSNGDLAGKIANRFNLNKDDVKSFLNEDRAAMDAARETKVSDALKTAGFSDAQITALKEKKAEQRSEMQAWHEANPNATRDEMKTQHEQEKSDFESWATSQGIDLSKVRDSLKDAMPMGGRGHGGPGGMMGGGQGMMDSDTASN